jgi:hypothetical protein
MTSRLDAIKARAELVAGKPDNCEPTEKEWDALTDGAIHDVPALLAAVEAALATHAWNTDGKCPECWADYPCNTVTAIRTALGEGEK